jgi:hypothetical protein
MNFQKNVILIFNIPKHLNESLNNNYYVPTYSMYIYFNFNVKFREFTHSTT